MGRRRDDFDLVIDVDSVLVRADEIEIRKNKRRHYDDSVGGASDRRKRHDDDDVGGASDRKRRRN